MTRQTILEAERTVIAFFLRIVFLSAAAWVEAVAYCHACSPSPSAAIPPAAEKMDRGPDEGHGELAPGPAVATDGPDPGGDVDEVDAEEEVRVQR